MFQWGGVGGGWGGVGWDDNVHVPMHTQAQQPHHLSCCWEETGTALSWSVTGGVGWVNKVSVPMPAHAQQPHHLSCCRALTRTALSWSVTLGGVGVGGVGMGGMITFMFLCTHRHSNLIIFLPIEQRQAQLFHDQLPVGWGELIRFMFLCLHTHSNLIIFLAVEHLHALLFHDQLQNCPTQNLKIFLHPYSWQPEHYKNSKSVNLLQIYC